MQRPKPGLRSPYSWPTECPTDRLNTPLLPLGAALCIMVPTLESALRLAHFLASALPPAD